MPTNGLVTPVVPVDRYDWLNGLGARLGPALCENGVLKLDCGKGLIPPNPLPMFRSRAMPAAILPIGIPPLAGDTALVVVICTTPKGDPSEALV